MAAGCCKTLIVACYVPEDCMLSLLWHWEAAVSEYQTLVIYCYSCQGVSGSWEADANWPLCRRPYTCSGLGLHCQWCVSTINPTWIGPGSNLACRGERLALKCFHCAAAHGWLWLWATCRWDVQNAVLLDNEMWLPVHVVLLY
jgi:hypothetical protein